MEETWRPADPPHGRPGRPAPTPPAQHARAHPFSTTEDALAPAVPHSQEPVDPSWTRQRLPPSGSTSKHSLNPAPGRSPPPGTAGPPAGPRPAVRPKRPARRAPQPQGTARAARHAIACRPTHGLLGPTPPERPLQLRPLGAQGPRPGLQTRKRDRLRHAPHIKPLCACVPICPVCPVSPLIPTSYFKGSACLTN